MPDFSIKIGASKSRPAGVLPFGIWGWNIGAGVGLEIAGVVGEDSVDGWWAAGASPGITIKSSPFEIGISVFSSAGSGSGVGFSFAGFFVGSGSLFDLVDFFCSESSDFFEVDF